MADYVSRRRLGVTRRMRLKGHDYTEPGYYFLTINEARNVCRFGHVMNARFAPYPPGEMIREEWIALADRFLDVTWDAFCIMPNHFHAIVGIGIDDPRGVARRSIPSIVQAFKSRTTVCYGKGVRDAGWNPYAGKLWHTGFHDHIVRTERELDRIRDYIENNPAKWNEDRFYTPER